jgi:uncharacterized metal-binding protein
MQQNLKTCACICKKQGCWGEENAPIPTYCQANKYKETIERIKENYSEQDIIDMYRAACVVGAKNDGIRTRIEEALDFVKQMNYIRIGFAACLAFDQEMSLVKKLFIKRDLEVIVAGCQIGNLSAIDRGTPELAKYGNSTCNPIGQAEILNKESTHLNFIVGLCMGHDILFSEHSKAPVSTLFVKDRMTGNNPIAALHGHHLRKSLFGVGRWEKE